MGLARPGGGGWTTAGDYENNLIQASTYNSQWAFTLSSLVIMLDYVVNHYTVSSCISQHQTSSLL